MSVCLSYDMESEIKVSRERQGLGSCCSFLTAEPRESWEQPKDWNRANKHLFSTCSLDPSYQSTDFKLTYSTDLAITRD